MIRVVGALLLLTACSVYGFTVARRYARRPEELRSLLFALQMLETEVVYGAVPLAKALHRVGVAVPMLVELFTDAASRVQKPDGGRAALAWSEALQLWAPQSSLNESDLLILRSFGESLGISAGPDQEKHFKLVQKHLESALSHAMHEREQKFRLFAYLGVSAGLAGILLLY